MVQIFPLQTGMEQSVLVATFGQIYIVDGEKISVNPEPVLSDLTSSLKLVPFNFMEKMRLLCDHCSIEIILLT